MKALIKRTSSQTMEPVLRKVLLEAAIEHHELHTMFELMGWGDLPEELKIEIKDDVKAYKDELEGNYSTCDPHVQRRRESVDFWVRSYENGDCTLQTAIDALKVRSL